MIQKEQSDLSRRFKTCADASSISYRNFIFKFPRQMDLQNSLFEASFHSICVSRHWDTRLAVECSELAFVVGYAEIIEPYFSFHLRQYSSSSLKFIPLALLKPKSAKSLWKFKLKKLNMYLRA